MDDQETSAREVKLDPALQARLIERMRAEQEASMRTRSLRRYLLLPLCVLVTLWSVDMSFSPDMTRALTGGLISSSLLWYFWIVRRRLPALFGLD